jgi:hypothetical protein
MADLHKLATCQRCHHLFVAQPGQRLCPECRQNLRRMRGRPWARRRTLPPLAIFAICTVGLALLTAVVHPNSIGIAAWAGGALALILISREM